jgi:hypothetical protein
VEVVLSNRTATVTGRVRDDQDQAVAHSHVVLFSADPQRWYVSSPYVTRVRSGGDGRFTMSGVPAGEYYAAAVEGFDGDGWRNPDVLTLLVGVARRIELREDQSMNADLRVQDVPY